MNQFSCLDAQSAESRFAQLSPEEVEEANAWFDWAIYGFEESSARPATPASPEARASR